MIGDFPTRREFLQKGATLAASAVSCPAWLGGSAQTSPRLWDLEPSLWEAAETVTISRALPMGDPQPEGSWGGGTAPNLSTRKLKITLWGPPAQLTLSVGKTDVWDRRRIFEPPLPLAQIKERVAKGASQGDYYRSWHAYDFPCAKPVGQVILRCPDLARASQPTAVTRCCDGTTKVEASAGATRAELTYLTMMTRNLMVIECHFQGCQSPVSVRLYRHQDTVLRGQSGVRPPEPLAGYDYSQDANNGPLEPPTSGNDGRFFWIRQRMPAEKTFPQGFECVLVGLVLGAAVSIDTVKGGKGLGTPAYLTSELQEQVNEQRGFWRLLPSYEAIRAAMGSAATATLPRSEQLRFTVLVAVVTTAEADDPLAEAKRQLAEAEREGFTRLVAENAKWYRAHYQRREKGRAFQGRAEFTRSQIPEIFRSWDCPHSKKCMPDPSHYEADAAYSFMEQDLSPWHGLPCYNELYYTSEHVRNRSDRLEMWYKLVTFWLPACKKNAREVFGLPGAALLHGYLPPIKADEYAHCIATWEFCMEIPAQVLKVLWDCYDYGGDEQFLAENVYPALRETAIFYAHYASLGEDGYYHVIPTVSAEHWGWTPHFARNRDSASALCMFRWLLNTAAHASEILGRDVDLRPGWREVAARIAPYPTYQSPEGPIFTDVRDVNPLGVEYNWFAGVTPCLLADEFNLDSDAKQKEMMLRTARLVHGWANDWVAPLLGTRKEIVWDVWKANNLVAGHFTPEELINSRSGRIHLFPAIPRNTTVAFRDMQARGGFEVSAECLEGEVTYVLVRSRRNLECQIMNPWPGRGIEVRGEQTRAKVPHRLDTSRGECVNFTTKPGNSYRIMPASPYQAASRRAASGCAA